MTERLSIHPRKQPQGRPREGKKPGMKDGRRSDGCDPMHSVELYEVRGPTTRLKRKLNRRAVAARAEEWLAS